MSSLRRALIFLGLAIGAICFIAVGLALLLLGSIAWLLVAIPYRVFKGHWPRPTMAFQVTRFGARAWKAGRAPQTGPHQANPRGHSSPDVMEAEVIDHK